MATMQNKIKSLTNFIKLLRINKINITDLTTEGGVCKYEINIPNNKHWLYKKENKKKFFELNEYIFQNFESKEYSDDLRIVWYIYN